MTLNDRERFIMHMSTVMTLASLGDPIDIIKVQQHVRQGRCRKLTEEDVNELFEDIKEEVLNGRAVYEEMISQLGEDNKIFKEFTRKPKRRGRTNDDWDDEMTFSNDM
jgi:hypothetical protein